MRVHSQKFVSDLVRVSIRSISAAVRFLGSPRVEICLIVAVVSAALLATVLHAIYDRAAGQWFVYQSMWYVGLLVLLSASLIAAMYVRWPWQRHLAGFVLIHTGLLVAVAGSLFNCWCGVEGTIVLNEGESTDHFEIGDRCQVMATWSDRPSEPPYLFLFESGPVDWATGTELDLGSIDGVGARVLRYFQHGLIQETWCADERRVGGPLVRFRLEGNGDGHIEYFLTDQDFGAELFVGPIALRLQRTTSAALLNHFLQPPNPELTGQGLLTIYYEDRIQLLDVDAHVGKTVDVGSGVSVELVQYLADARLDRSGKFQPQGTEPRNPFVELLVHVPNDSKPHRQVAFAKSPLLNLDGVYDRVCPVKFVYQHPKIKPTTAIEFLQCSDGKLYCRTTDGDHYHVSGEVSVGSRLTLPVGFTCAITEYLPHAQRLISFEPAQRSGRPSEKLEPAVELEITVAGRSERRWLQRNHLEFQRGTLETPDGPLIVRFGNARSPLGFVLRLIDCYGDSNRGSTTATVSTVELIDEDGKAERQHQISTAQPLKHHGFLLYQSAVRDAGHGKQAAVLQVRYDPARPLKAAGIWTIVLGTATTFAIRTRWSIGLQRQWQLSGI